MIHNLSEYELIKKQKSSKISSTTIIIAMVLMTAVGCSLFALLRALFPPQGTFDFPVGFEFDENDNEVLRFLSQTYDPVKKRYVVSLSLKVPADLIDNEDFKDKVCEEFRNEIEDGFDRKFLGSKVVLADLIKHQIERSGISIGIFYYLKITEGKVETDGDLMMGVFAGWENYIIEFFELVHKTRIERAMQPKGSEFKGSKEEVVVATSSVEIKHVLDVDPEKNHILIEYYDD